jgi:H+/Cl- antiporter ClcA
MFGLLSATCLVLIPIFFFVFPGWAIVDICRTNKGEWLATAKPKWLVIVVIVCTLVFGAAWYAWDVRPKIMNSNTPER